MGLSSRARGRLHVHADFDRQRLSYGCNLSRNASVPPAKVVLPFTCVTVPAGVPASAPGSVIVPAGSPRNVPFGLLVVLVALANVYGGAEASPATYMLPSDATAIDSPLSLSTPPHLAASTALPVAARNRTMNASPPPPPKPVLPVMRIVPSGATVTPSAASSTEPNGTPQAPLQSAVNLTSAPFWPLPAMRALPVM